MNRIKWKHKRYMFLGMVIIMLLIVTAVRLYGQDVTVNLSSHMTVATRESKTTPSTGLSNPTASETVTAGVATSLSCLNCSLGTLKKTSTPLIVYQILTSRSFTFKNYLSVLSVFKILQPYRIILYVRADFKSEPLEYNMWFDKAVDIIPYLEVRRYSDQTDLHNGKSELRVLSKDLNVFGGIYVNLNTIINKDLFKLSVANIQIGIFGNSSIGFIQVSQGFHFIQKIRMFADLRKENFTTKCVLPREFKGHERCCTIPYDIYPQDIMRNTSPFGSFARFLFYGASQIPEPQRTFLPIPKIVHYVWFGEGKMTYAMYLSFMSTLRFVKPLQIIIYVDSYTLGPYFNAMRNFSIVSVVYYGRPTSVFQRPISEYPHISDYVRADVLLRSGGIYLDWDAFWLKPVDDLLALGYETIASLDFFKGISPREEFPDLINMGILLARPGSRFVALWLESFRTYTGEHPTFHAVEMVYKLYEYHPDLLYLEKTLQVMCYKFRCHPLWLPNYQDESVHNEFNFTKDAYTVHFTEPIPKEFESVKAMRKSKGFFAVMARHVHGILVY